MPKHLLVIMSNPVEGEEKNLLEWYRSEHLQDMTALAGVEAAQIFELDPYLTGEGIHSPHRFMAIYEVPQEREQQAKEALAHARDERQPAMEAGRRPILPGTPYMAGGNTSSWFTEVSERVTNPTKD